MFGWLAGAADLECEGAVLDLSQQPLHDRLRQRRDSPQPGADRALRVEATGPQRIHHPPGSFQGLGQGAQGGAHDKCGARRKPASLEVDKEPICAGCYEEERGRQGDRQQPDRRLEAEGAPAIGR